MADVVVSSVAACFDCGWDGPPRMLRSDARNDADNHDCAGLEGRATS